jgi:hypothetical protein
MALIVAEPPKIQKKEVRILLSGPNLFDCGFSRAIRYANDETYIPIEPFDMPRNEGALQI